MRIDLLEKMVLVLAVMSVLFVGGTVFVFSVIFPAGMSSGIPQVVIDSEYATQDWLDDKRRSLGLQTGTVIEEFGNRDRITIPDRPVAAAQPNTGNQGNSSESSGNQRHTASSSDAVSGYWATAGHIPENDQVPGIPWLRAQPGVTYLAPQRVPEMLYRKYQSFDDTWELVQEGGGEFVQTTGGDTAYQVNWVDEQSMLSRRLGLRPGDKVISVNGQPIGTSLTAGKALFDQLRGETRFAVKIERDNSPMVLSFSVQ